MSKVKNQDIKGIVWSACDTFRGVIDPSQYKDYILTMLFLKYVNDVNKELRSKYLEKYDGDVERVERAMKKERFVVPENATFDYLYENRKRSNIGELIDIALADLMEHNREKLTSEGGSGVFRNISFNSTNLGDQENKNQRLKDLLTDFEKLDLMPSHLANDDAIGDAYEFLIEQFASDAGKKAGEFYTPKEVSMLVAKLTKSKEGARIYDPTCGSGSLLIRAANELGSKNVSINGQEINGSTWAIAIMNMFLNQYDQADIRWGDTIRSPKHKDGDALLKFDTVVANPPFSLKKWGKDDVSDDKHNRFWRGLPPKSRGDWAFITHMIEVAKSDGKVGTVVPHGVLFRSGAEATIRQSIIEENILDALIGLPENLFYGTSIPAAILIIDKARDKNADVLFIDASEHYKSGTNQNVLREQDIEKIVTTFKQYKKGDFEPGVVEEKYSYIATFEEMKENDFNLNIPRYVDTFEEEELVDIEAVQQEIKELEGQLETVQEEMKKYLEQL